MSHEMVTQRKPIRMSERWLFPTRYVSRSAFDDLVAYLVKECDAVTYENEKFICRDVGKLGFNEVVGDVTWCLVGKNDNLGKEVSIFHSKQGFDLRCALEQPINGSKEKAFLTEWCRSLPYSYGQFYFHSKVGSVAHFLLSATASYIVGSWAQSVSPPSFPYGFVMTVPALLVLLFGHNLISARFGIGCLTSDDDQKSSPPVNVALMGIVTISLSVGLFAGYVLSQLAPFRAWTG